jgi:hypothetical protein
MNTRLSRFVLGVWVLGAVFLGGCANTAGKDEGGASVQTVQVTLTFAGAVDTLSNRYYVIFSGTQDPLIPSIPPDTYFPTPGRNYDELHVQFQNQSDPILPFYTDYFSTWSDYIVVDSEGISLFKSGTGSFVAMLSDDHFNYQRSLSFSGSSTVNGNTLIVRVPLSQLTASGATRLYYTIATSDKDSTQAGMLKDILQNDAPSILVGPNAQEGPFSDSTDASIPSLDLIEWSIDIF